LPNITTNKITSLQLPTEQRGSGPDFDSFFMIDSKLRSRGREDKIIYEKFFKGKLQGPGNYIELVLMMVRKNLIQDSMMFAWDGRSF
jgi:hypothetical protein